MKNKTGKAINVRLMKKCHYAWVIVILTFAMLMINAGVRSIPSIIMKPLETEFSWSRAHVSAAIAISFVTFGLGGPLGGKLIDKYNSKVVMTTGLTLIGAGLGLMLPMTTNWQLNVFWGILVGLGTGVSGTVIGAVVAERWFVKQRGIVLGVFSSASSLAQMLFFPLLAALTAGYGWRGSVGVMLFLICILIPLLKVFMKSKPADVGALPYGESGSNSSEGKSVVKNKVAVTTVFEAVHTMDFWLLTGTFFICGFTSDGFIGTHFLLHATEQGISNVTAASALGVMGLMNVMWTLVSGWLTDRYDPRKLLAFFYAFRALLLFSMPYIEGPVTLFLFAMLYGLDWNATVPPTIELSARRFGNEALGTIFGLIFCAHMIGAGLAAYAGGLWHDLFGNYYSIIIFSGILGMMAMLFCLKMSDRSLAVIKFATAKDVERR